MLSDIARERGVEKGYVIDTFKSSLGSVVKKKFGKTAEAEVEMTETTGEIKIYRVMTIVREVEDSAFEITKEAAKQYQIFLVIS